MESLARSISGQNEVVCFYPIATGESARGLYLRGLNMLYCSLGLLLLLDCCCRFDGWLRLVYGARSVEGRYTMVPSSEQPHRERILAFVSLHWQVFSLLAQRILRRLLTRNRFRLVCRKQSCFLSVQRTHCCRKQKKRESEISICKAFEMFCY